MKILSELTGKNIRVYKNSFLSIHFTVVVISLLLYVVARIFDLIDIKSDDFLYILNGMGVLTAFIILALDKIEISTLKIKFPALTKNLKGDDINVGVKLANTAFSITFSIFTLLGIQYILLFFRIECVLLLISLVVTIFSGFLLVLSIWHSSDI